MKLTKDQRFTAYCIMLAEAEQEMAIPLWDRESSRHGFCNMILHVFDVDDNYFNPFPELNKKKPELMNGEYWFGKDEEGWDQRRRLLKQCIIETHP